MSSFFISSMLKVTTLRLKQTYGTTSFRLGRRAMSLTASHGPTPGYALIEEGLDAWIRDVSSKKLTYRDEISRSKLADLYVTLPTRSPEALQASVGNNHIDPLHTLAFFHPRFAEKDLGEDGTDRTFCPPPPFERRMWAGGSFLFPLVISGEGKASGIQRSKVGTPDEAISDSRVVDVVKKGFMGADGKPGKNPMVFVQQELTYRSRPETKVEVVEKRSHVYLPTHIRANIRSPRNFENLPASQYKFSWTPTPTTLFRFSALTWNAHRIHLDREYAREVEGYPERLVHGPLTALMLMEALRAPSEMGGGASVIGKKKVAMFTYRAVNPVIVGRRQHLCGAFIPADHSVLGTIKEEKAEGLDAAEKVVVWAEDDDGVVGMVGLVSVVA